LKTRFISRSRPFATQVIVDIYTILNIFVSLDYFGQVCKMQSVFGFELQLAQQGYMTVALMEKLGRLRSC